MGTLRRLLDRALDETGKASAVMIFAVLMLSASRDRSSASMAAAGSLLLTAYWVLVGVRWAMRRAGLWPVARPVPTDDTGPARP